MNNWLGRSELFFKQHGSTILTFVGAAGVIATAVLAAKASTKAVNKIKEAEEEKGEKLTTKETVQVTAVTYIPTIVTGTATIACMLGANVLNKNKQASLVSAYMLIDNAYKEYRDKVEEIYGEGSDIRIQEEIAKDHYAESIKIEYEKTLFYDVFSKRYFEATMLDVVQAEADLNRLIVNQDAAFLNDYYELMGLDTTPEGKELGWSTGILESMYWANWVDFDHKAVTMEDGRECYMITMVQEPVIDFAYY